jgi:hypothetical protein
LKEDQPADRVESPHIILREPVNEIGKARFPGSTPIWQAPGEPGLMAGGRGPHRQHPSYPVTIRGPRGVSQAAARRIPIPGIPYASHRTTPQCAPTRCRPNPSTVSTGLKRYIASSKKCLPNVTNSPHLYSDRLTAMDSIHESRAIRFETNRHPAEAHKGLPDRADAGYRPRAPARSSASGRRLAAGDDATQWLQ